MKNAILAFLLASSILLSCKKRESNCPYDPCLTKAPPAEVVQVETYLSSKNIMAVKHCSGMYYLINSPGTGATPTVCSSISVTYTGHLMNGDVFNQTSDPVSFNLFQLIDGWKNGIPLLKEGGRIMLFVPPSLGYGNSDYRGIPGNSVLIFDITLVDVR